MHRISARDLERYQFYQILSLSESAGRIQTKNKEIKLLRETKNKRISEESGLAFWWYEKNSRLKTRSLRLHSYPVSKANPKFFLKPPTFLWMTPLYFCICPASRADPCVFPSFGLWPHMPWIDPDTNYGIIFQIIVICCGRGIITDVFRFSTDSNLNQE